MTRFEKLLGVIVISQEAKPHESAALVNSVVGFTGPEYLSDERQIIRAGLEDHFMGKLLGLPMGCDVCYTNHAAADQNSTDNLLLLTVIQHHIVGTRNAHEIVAARGRIHQLSRGTGCPAR